MSSEQKWQELTVSLCPLRILNCICKQIEQSLGILFFEIIFDSFLHKREHENNDGSRIFRLCLSEEFVSLSRHWAAAAFTITWSKRKVAGFDCSGGKEAVFGGAGLFSPIPLSCKARFIFKTC